MFLLRISFNKLLQCHDIYFCHSLHEGFQHPTKIMSWDAAAWSLFPETQQTFGLRTLRLVSTFQFENYNPNIVILVQVYAFKKNYVD